MQLTLERTHEGIREPKLQEHIFTSLHMSLNEFARSRREHMFECDMCAKPGENKIWHSPPAQHHVIGDVYDASFETCMPLRREVRSHAKKLQGLSIG